VVLVVLAARLVELDTVDAGRYTSYGQRELYDHVTLPALRGAIYDRSGQLLAESLPREAVVADDFLIHHPRAEASTLAKDLGSGVGAITAELTERNGYVVLAGAVGTGVANTISHQVLAGITLIPTTIRATPGGSSMQPLLGVVNAAGSGASGLEYEYNALLAGHPGSEELPEAPGDLEPPGSPTRVHRAVQGDGLVLTISAAAQYEVTSDLAAQIHATRAKSGIAILSDPRNGDVLAMVDLVAGPGGSVVPAEQNAALTSVYEPGSVMKLVTVSGALQDHVISPDEELTVPHQITVGGWTFEDAWWHPTELLPVSQIIAQSSNVGTIEIAHRLGEVRLSHFLHDFGYGEPTGLDWPGASQGILGSPATWSAAAMGAVPIGTDEAVTAMQVLDAYNSEANGGVFVPPRLVEATVDAAGQEQMIPAPPRRRVVSRTVAAQVLPFFEDVVTDGTAVAAQIPGYTVAGKTGTAQIPSSTGPGYTEGAWMATFVGFAPAQSPQLSAIVVLDEPQTSIYGGDVSAPVFAKLMGWALRHYHIPPAGPSTQSPRSLAP
jgi:cell division protein FtsI (penicillin-binding protein 3)